MEVNTQDAADIQETAQAENQLNASDVTNNRVDTRSVEIDALKAELAKAKTQSIEYLDGWQRARADFSNYKKRQETEYASQRALSTGVLVAKLLPVLDDFERASKTLPTGLREMTWIGGVLLIHRKLQLVLEGEGIKLIEVKPNDSFDPSIHEAVSQDDAEGIESGRIIEELQRGYKLADRVLRPALVRVAR